MVLALFVLDFGQSSRQVWKTAAGDNPLGLTMVQTRATLSCLDAVGASCNDIFLSRRRHVNREPRPNSRTTRSGDSAKFGVTAT